MMRRSLASLLRRLAGRLDPVQPALLYHPHTYSNASTTAWYTLYGDTK